MKIIKIFSSLGIGDIITLGPLLKKLKSVYPESKITTVSVRPGDAQELTTTKELFYIDEVIILNKLSGLFKVFKKSDLLIFLGYYFKHSGLFKTLLYHFLYFLLKSDEKIKYNELGLPKFKNLNMVEIKLDILKKLGINLFNEDYELFLPFSFSVQKEKVERILKEGKINPESLLVGIHNGKKEGYFASFWSVENWIKTVKYLKKRYGVEFFFVGGKNEAENTRRIIDKLNFPVLNLVGKLSIKETTALINKCGLFISTNSGPMWLAAALRKPQIALCGPSKFAWDPYNKNATVVRKIIERKHCNPPCDIKTCYYKDNLCMKSITVENVLNVIDNLMINVGK